MAADAALGFLGRDRGEAGEVGTVGRGKGENEVRGNKR